MNDKSFTTGTDWFLLRSILLLHCENNETKIKAMNEWVGSEDCTKFGGNWSDSSRVKEGHK